MPGSPTRISSCLRCRELVRESEGVHVSRIFPNKSRGYYCERCANRLEQIMRVI